MSTSQQPPCRSPSDPDSSADTPKVAHDRPVQVCIVTGLSGAGKSTAVQVFEDLRYFAVDGLPASLAPEMAAMMERPSMSHFMGIALGMDMRQSNFPDEINDALSVMAAKGIRPLLLFLEADAQELMRRYATTRRPHPLEREGMGLEAALAAERNRLRPLREMADLVIDTSPMPVSPSPLSAVRELSLHWFFFLMIRPPPRSTRTVTLLHDALPICFSIHDLRRSIQKRWSGNKDKLRAIRVNVISFGFKYGVPREADTVFDLRFLPNPYFVEELRPLCGKDKAVADYVFASPSAVEFRKKLLDLLFFMLPLMEAEGRYRITIAVGCTGGRHRSVAMAEELSQALRQADYPTSLEHRHLELG